MKEVELDASQATDAVLTDEQLLWLTKLTAFTVDTGCVIDGCGCCGSPSLSRNDAYLNDLSWSGTQYRVRLTSTQLNGGDVLARDGLAHLLGNYP